MMENNIKKLFLFLRLAGRPQMLIKMIKTSLGSVITISPIL